MIHIKVFPCVQKHVHDTYKGVSLGAKSFTWTIDVPNCPVIMFTPPPPSEGAIGMAAVSINTFACVYTDT
jgi:hypothetical protein